jgi:hypothetical protein
MAYLIAVEHDPKCYKDIAESLVGLAKELGHEFLLFENLADFKTEFNKPEHAEHAVLLMIVSYEEALKDPKKDLTTSLNEIKTQYKCDVLLTMFEDPLKPLKKSSFLPVQNIIYKPFDLTILKEHTRFALNLGTKIKTSYVHTTQVQTEIEMLKKFRISDISEFGFKVDKLNKLDPTIAYKFYHPLFESRKTQSIWARVVNETPDFYELLFCQSVPSILSHLRKKVATSPQKVKNATWAGLKTNTQKQLKIALQIDNTDLSESLQDLLTRNFKNLSFIQNKEIDPTAKITADVLLTEAALDQKILAQQFTNLPLVIRLYDASENLKRADLEAQFLTEFLRIEKPVDKAALMKSFKLFFPNLEEADEKVQLLTVHLDEMCSLSEVVKIQEFSEAAILFTDHTKYDLGQVLDIALPHEDETSLQEIKAKVHFSSPNPDGHKLYEQQFVLFGMKDEHLKLLRLWALQKHIEKNKKGA